MVLSGGNDLASVGGGPLSLERDEFESRAIECAQARNLPLLGVCRGMQLLAERAGFSVAACAGHVGTEHRLLLAGPTRLGALAEVSLANSFHGFAVEAPAKSEFVVALRSEDGVVEAIEHTSRRALGIMWHPERYPSPRAIDVELFRQALLP
jgi:N5-(cytidine 5'-diphosphoramidyl)-L-glutamine hydrolase